MSFGAKIINNSGNIMVDGNFANYALSSKGQVTSPPPFGYGWSQIILTLPTVDGVIALSCPYKHYILGIYTAGGNTTYYIRVKASGVVVKWFLFAKPTFGSSTEQYGMVIRNAANQIVFDSRLVYMRVIDFVAGMAGGLTNTSTLVASRGYAGKTIAVVQCQLSTYYETLPLPDGATDFYDSLVYISNVSSLNAYYELIADQKVQTAAVGYSYPNYALMVLDVTNF